MREKSQLEIHFYSQPLLHLILYTAYIFKAECISLYAKAVRVAGKMPAHSNDE